MVPFSIIFVGEFCVTIYMRANTGAYPVFLVVRRIKETAIICCFIIRTTNIAIISDLVLHWYYNFTICIK